jgi:selenide,water dikinase
MPTDPKLIVGACGYDDAGVYRLNDDTALIQTVDFFTPIVDDPYNFGQIAAANSLSDVYAMGGKPILAMNIVCFPINDMSKEILKEILAGGLAKIREAGALLVGGHSVEDAETKYGLSVTGIVHPDQVLLNAGARVGDLLLLTKPLGTGILATAIKGGLVGEEVEAQITACMACLNKAAGEAMVGLAHGATDITGFGLIGHAHEMAAASRVAIRLNLAAIPLLPQTVDFANMGIIPEGGHKNLKFYRKCLTSSLPEGDAMELILADPQTSGGLLIAASEANIREIQKKITASDYPYETAIIGEVVAGEPGTITI